MSEHIYRSVEEIRSDLARPQPGSAQAQAIELAEARQDYYVKWGFEDTGVRTEGPFSEADKDELVSRIFVLPGVRITVFKVVEEYGGHE